MQLAYKKRSSDNTPKKVWLGLGGNIGDVPSTLKYALADIEQSSENHLISVSSFYQTPPWGKIDQNRFVNICCEIETLFDPEKLLQFCLHIEKKYGRERKIKWGPRTLDIDLLVYENIPHYRSETLTLPHPLMTERAFVLYPLCEIAPTLVVNGRTIKEWKKDCADDGIVILPTHFTMR